MNPRCYRIIYISLLALGLTACRSPETIAPGVQLPTIVANSTAGPEPRLVTTIPNTATFMPVAVTLTPTPTATWLTPVCTPFDGWSFQDLEAAVTNPFHPPPVGSDDPHQGADFSLLDPTGGFATSGQPIQAVLPGKVVMVMADRFPYGNAVLVESDIEALPVGWRQKLKLPAEAVVPDVSSPLSCPQIVLPDWEQENLSLYTLYAHMLDTPLAVEGDPIQCGDDIGVVGGSGNALNPHLHLELRIGPAGALQGAMAHYDPSGSVEEMGNYCLWRISGRFLAQDPLGLLQELP